MSDDGSFPRKAGIEPTPPRACDARAGNATLPTATIGAPFFLKMWHPGNMHVFGGALDFHQCRHSLGGRNETIVFG